LSNERCCAKVAGSGRRLGSQPCWFIASAGILLSGSRRLKAQEDRVLIIVCCPLCGEVWETGGTPGYAATVMVVCPQCEHVFDVAQPAEAAPPVDA
jgi:hypothetical protein